MFCFKFLFFTLFIFELNRYNPNPNDIWLLYGFYDAIQF